MKKIVLILISFAGMWSNAEAQSGSWLWGKYAGGGGAEGMSVATDNAGNVFGTGFYNSTMHFGASTLINPDSIFGGYSVQTFLVKYNTSGSFLWAKGSSGAGGNRANAVAIDIFGNAIIVGSFHSPAITFSSITLINSDTSGFAPDMFIVKYDANGNVLWGKKPGGMGGDEATSVTTDEQGNIYVAGSFTSSIINFGSFTLTSPGYIFVTKYDAAGNVIWAKNMGGMGGDFSNSIAVNNNGVYLTGSFASSGFTFGPSTLTNMGGDDIFIAKYDLSGNPIWAISGGGANNDLGYSITTNSSVIYIAGTFYSPSISLGGVALNTSFPASGGVFLAKIDSAGNGVWARNAGGNGGSNGFSVASDASGVYVVGGFGSPYIIFNPADTLFYPSGSVDPLFLVKYDASGNVICFTGLISGGDDYSAVAADEFGSAYVVGDYASNPMVLGTDILPYNLHENFFVAKYKCHLNDAIDEITSAESITIFPNPATSTFTLITTGNKIKEIKIINLLGEEISSRSTAINNTQSTIDIQQFSKGMYIVEVLTNKGIERSKILIQ